MAKGFVNLNPFKYGKAIKQRSKRKDTRQGKAKGKKEGSWLK